MSQLFQRVQKTIREISNHPLVSVDTLSIGQPATPSFIDTFEMVTGVRVPSPVKSFYLAADGLTFIWRIKPGLDEETMNRIKDAGEERGYDYEKPLGAIRILRLQDMLMNTTWKPPSEEDPGAGDPFSFGGKDYTRLSFGKMLRPLDLFEVARNDAKCMALLLRPDAASGELIMLDDHWADWHNSRIVDFESYLTAMCATRFTIPSRNRLFGKYRGDLEPAVSYAALAKEDLTPAFLVA